MKNQQNIIIYNTDDGKANVVLMAKDGNIWMKQTKLHILLFAMALLALASCNKEEAGLKDIAHMMEWKTDVPVKDDDRVEVSAEGGIYKFECTNYDGFWFKNVLANDEYLNIEDEKSIAVTGEWFDMKVEGNVLEVVISPNDDYWDRKMEVVVEAAVNAFGGFTFKQHGLSK